MAGISLGIRSSIVAALAAAMTLAVARTGHADCAGFYAQAWPDAGTTGFPTNGSLLVHVASVAAFDPSTIELRDAANGQRVVLRIVRDLRVSAAYLGRRTLVLQPTRPLRASSTYRIVVGASAQQRALVDQTFVTATGPDSTVPTLASAIAGAYVEEEFGCGPARNVRIALRGLGDGDGPRPWVHMRVARTVADLRAGRLLGEIIEPPDGEGNVSIGHDMCAGGWPLEPGDELVLGVSALDAALRESTVRETVARARR